MFHTLINYPVTAPIKAIAFSILFTITCVLGLPKIILEGNLEAMMSPQDPLLRQLYDIEAEFTESHTAIIGLVADNGVFNQTAINAIQSITDAAWGLPYVYRVDSISNFQYTHADGDDLWVSDLFPPDIEANSEAFAAAKTIALRQPETLNQLVSADEKMAAINLSFSLDGNGSYDQQAVTIRFGEQEVYPNPATPEALIELQAYLAGDEVHIGVDLGVADGTFTAYGCDLTDGYVRVNADYTT